MAKPLTSEDMFRLKSGWGSSSDPAQRQRLASAGYSPLTSEEKMRVERGWGASPLASVEDQNAMVAAEVNAGNRTSADLPEAYGGMPTGSTRRDIRMRDEWVKRQAIIDRDEQAKREAIQAQAERQRQDEADKRAEESHFYSTERSKIELANAQKAQVLSEKTAAQEQLEVANILNVLGTLDFKGNPQEAQAAMDKVLGDNSTGANSNQIKGAVENYRKIAQGYAVPIQQQEYITAMEVSKRSGRPFSDFVTFNDVGEKTVNREAIALAQTDINMAAEREAKKAPQIDRLNREIGDLSAELTGATSAVAGENQNYEEAAKARVRIPELQSKLDNRRREFDLLTLPRINSPEELKKLVDEKQIRSGDRFIGSDGEAVTYTERSTPSTAPTSAGTLAEPTVTPSQAAPPTTNPATQAAPSPTPQQSRDQKIKQYEAVVNDPNADFLTKAEAKTQIANIQQQIESENASAPKLKEAAARSTMQTSSAASVASLQGELNKYYDVLFDKGSFNPSTGTPMAAKAGIDKDTLKQGLQKIASIRTELGEDPKTIQLELEQIYSQALRSMR
jgi:hypothetical protein